MERVPAVFKRGDSLSGLVGSFVVRRVVFHACRVPQESARTPESG
jgi:hypothetical protein